MTTSPVLNALSHHGELNRRDLYQKLVTLMPGTIDCELRRLVKLGRITRIVKTEWDKAPGTHVAGLFGGSAVCVRHRAYYSLTS